MARGINKVQLIGNCGDDPTVRYTPSGACVTTISIATTEAWKDRDGLKQENTEWHRVVLWNKLGEIAGEYLKKGSQVYIEGKLRTNKWTDQNGQDRYTTEVIASEMQMLGSPSNSSSGGFGGQQQSGGFQPKQNTTQQAQNQQPKQTPNFDDFGGFDDEVPF